MWRTKVHVFSLTFRIIVDTDTHIVKLSTTTKTLAYRKMNVYLVDDDGEDHEIFEMALEETSLGVQFKSFYSGPELIAYLNSGQTPQDQSGLLIFTDLNMPLMNGFELISNLNSLGHLSAGYKIVVYSTNANDEYKKQAKNLGASLYLIKPISFKALVNTLKEVLTELSVEI